MLRSMNNRVVLGLLIERGTLSRGDVRELTGLSKPTASQLLTRLEESGLVLPSGYGDTGPGGRAPQLYTINPNAGHAAAVDVRQESISARIADIAGTVVAESELMRLPEPHRPEHVAQVLADACKVAGIAVEDLDAIVVAVPGSYDVAADLLRYAEHLPGWQQPGIGDDLRRHLGGAAVSLENDVNLVALAEHRASDVDGESFFLLWLDEGIGGALMMDGSLFRGSRGAAGEAAFLLPPGSRLDGEHRSKGAFEGLVGSDALRELAIAAGHPADSTADAIAALLADAAAAETIQEIAQRYAFGLASVIALVDPSRLILAGEVARIGGPRLRDAVAAHLDRLVISAPSLDLAAVADEPILEGAMLLSLDLARESVFTT
jgi:predicted NBD/HSP70 family sugar kinase